jgi:uncharacterized protein
MQRDAAKPVRDFGILVDFSDKITCAPYFRVLFYLEDLFGCAVDLLTQKALHKDLHTFVEREALHVRQCATG